MSARKASGAASSAAVRTMNPPLSCGSMAASTTERRRSRSVSFSMRADTPTPRPLGMNTRYREGKVM
jgi:hypothetical protein